RQHGESGGSGETRGALRREDRRLLVPDVENRHRRIGLDSAVVDGGYVPAGEREHRLHPVGARGGDRLCAAMRDRLLIRRHAGDVTSRSPAALVPSRCDDGCVPTMNDLARRAQIGSADLDWLHSLVSDWELLADLSFADLTLWAPLTAERSWIALA